MKQSLRTTVASLEAFDEHGNKIGTVTIGTARFHAFRNADGKRREFANFQWALIFLQGEIDD